MNNQSGYIALIVAGGSGSRSGFDTPKQYLPLLGNSVIGHSVALFARDPDCRAVYIALGPAHREACSNAIAGIDGTITLLETAGESRQATVRASLGALAALKELHDGATILVHDAARPCLNPPALLFRYKERLCFSPAGTRFLHDRACGDEGDERAREMNRSCSISSR